jgi:3D (Asp-Asp-Asp) domain-containing protein
MGYGTRSIDYDYEVSDIVNVHFPIGTKVNVKTKIDKSIVSLYGTVIADYPYFIVVDTGLYKMAVNKVDLVYKYGATAVSVIK